MSNRLRTILLLLSICCARIVVAQQDISVADFQLLETDMTANSAGTRKIDSNGEVAALIKVITIEKGLVFDVGAMGIVDKVQHVGEIWVYVPSGIKRITVKHPTLRPLENYPIPANTPIEAARTYKMVLEAKDTRQGGFELVFTPATAHVVVDGEDWTNSTFDGNLRTRLFYGQHTYEISADGYETRQGTFVINGPRVNLQVELAELPTLTLVAPDDDGEIFLDGVSIGTGRWTGRVGLGSHVAEVRQEGFQAQPQSFVLAAGQELTAELEAPISLKANLTVRSPLEGAQIYLNGELMGTTEWIGELDAATYTVELRMEGYSTVSETVTLAAGQELTAELEAPMSLKANLTVRSPLEGAQIYLNGELMGVTEWIGELDAATYTVELRMEDYSTVSETVTLAQREERTLTMEAPTPLFGSLVVNSEPSDCNVYLDDELIKNTAEAFRRIAVGNHRLLLTKEGYESVELAVNIEGGRQTTLTPRLEPIVVPQDTIVPQDTVATAMVETLLPDSSIFTPNTPSLTVTPSAVSPKKRANAYWRSLLVPGWGDKYVRESGRFGAWKTIGAYGLIGAGVGMHFYGKEQYAQYETMVYDRYTGTASHTREALDEKLALANTYRKTVPVLVGAGAAVWLYDVIWVAVKGRKSQNTSLALDYDPQVNSGYLSYSITF